MTAHRTAAAAVIAGVVPFALTLAAAPAAQAHGAPTDPVSRVAACSSQGAARASSACRAAIAANGGSAFEEWDNLRVADVRGRDRRFIPDGQLCSAGLDAYRGLDIARRDWSATPLEPGRDFTLTYRTTIPHEGTFSLYLTKQGYDPSKPLRWDDLDPRPFAKATDPELRDGAYRIRGRIPSGLSGRHVLYTVWRNSSTPDTYYSCSDVVMPGGKQAQNLPAFPPPSQGQAPPGEKPPTEATPGKEPPSRPPSQAPTPEQSARLPAPPADRQAPASAEREDDSAVIAGGAAAVLALFAVVLSAVLRRRAAR
ncbi:lytic polysaccharide monooxygenase [Streptomyces sp. NBC_00829]|uniref:lytic polysaccharide monooxygenase auxiliary activity family 9 protein n=1 Tax=Streptomyces sp. NBC_00829 TaxID=2903679 RepID=UPI00386EEB72|nr:lytic polysaccharide monooxygenase [Streptomyces sp. NBC_00829]